MATRKQPHFLVHNREDSVGVAVVEDIVPGKMLSGRMMDGGEPVRVKSRSTIPLGHKVALRDMTDGETVYKYGHDIGRTVAAIRKGDHVHVHNVKTKRW